MCGWQGYLAQADVVYLGDLAELHDDPFVCLALIFDKGVPIAIQDRLWLPRLFISGHNLGSILG